MLSLAGCDRVFNLTRPPDAAIDMAPPIDAIDAPPGTCDWATASPVSPVPMKASALAVGRFNNDDMLDVAVGTAADEVLFVFYAGNSGFPTYETFDSTEPIHALASGRIDSDDLDDLAAAGTTTAAAFLATGTSWDRRAVTLSAQDPGSIAIADLNQMGLRDLIVTFPDGDAAAIVMGGDTAYVNGQQIPTLSGPAAVAVANYDGDSDVDLAIALAQDGSVSLHPDDGSNFVTGPVFSGGAVGPSAIAFARLGTRTVLDIVVSNRMSHDVTVFRNNGSGSFTPDPAHGVDQEPVALVVADLDASGHADILTANHKSHSISLLRGTETGFGLARMFSTVDKPVGISVADVDGDSNLDIVVLGEAGFVIHRGICN